MNENFNKFYRKARFGFEVLRAFAEIGINTNYRVKVLLKLYDNSNKGKETTREELKKAVGIENDGQFTSSVLIPLVEESCIKISRGKNKLVSLTSVGESSVDEVIDEVY